MAGWPSNWPRPHNAPPPPHLPYVPMVPGPQQQFPPNMNQRFPMGHYPVQGYPPAPPPHLMMPPPPPHQIMMQQQLPMYNQHPPVHPPQPWQQQVRILRDPYQGGYENPLQKQIELENGKNTINGVESENKQKEREEQERLQQGINPAPPSSHNIQQIAKDSNLMLFSSSTAGAQQHQQQPISETMKSNSESIFVSQHLSTQPTVNISNYNLLSTNVHDNYDNDDNDVECSESDSGQSVGGEIDDLTGDEDEDENLKILDSDDDKTKRLKTLKRKLLRKENEIIKFWLNRRPDNPELKPFPDVFKLRDKDVENSAKSVFKFLFAAASVPQYLRPVFENPPNSRPDLGHYFIRLSWNNLKNTVHAYGKSVDTAENSAAILGLKQILGEEEYDNIVRTQQATKVEGINVQRIQNHLLQKWKKSRIRNRKFHMERKQMEKTTIILDFEVLNTPDILTEITDCTRLLKPELQSPSLQMRVKSRRRLNSETWKNSTKPTNPNILQKITDISSPIIALGALMSAKSLPIPDYISVKYNSKVKVECVVEGKYFTVEAPTEEEAKLKSAGIALKFLLGNLPYEKWKQNKL